MRAARGTNPCRGRTASDGGAPISPSGTAGFKKGDGYSWPELLMLDAGVTAQNGTKVDEISQGVYSENCTAGRCSGWRHARLRAMFDRNGQFGTDPKWRDCGAVGSLSNLRTRALAHLAAARMASRTLLLLAGACAVGVAAARMQPAPSPGIDPGEGLPQRLQDTGLYAPGTNRTAADVQPFSPRYPLWADGADKRRWIQLPAGSFIDASNPDAWKFPAGARLWKEFGYAGKPMETRLMELRSDGQWRFATYLWNEAGSEATLAPREGVPALPVAAAPNGRFAVPSRADCLTCHNSASAPVLGFTAVQLAPRNAGEVGLRDLVARGLLRGIPAKLLDQAPEMAASTSLERAVLGYLHGNCAHCHNAGPNKVPRPLNLEQRAADPVAARREVLRSLVGAPSSWEAQRNGPGQIVESGRSDRSVLIERMHTREPRVRMPPLGTELPDEKALLLMRRWIDQELPSRKDPLQ